MKTFVTSLVLAALIAPLAACETHSATTAKRNWDGSTTYQNTTVHENNLTGTTSVDQTKTRVR
jgi:hypothetical protein